MYVSIPILGQLQNSANTGGGTIITNLGVYISNIVGIVLILASIVTFFYLAYGGLMWILSSGDKGKVEEARNRITNALVGLTLVGYLPPRRLLFWIKYRGRFGWIERWWWRKFRYHLCCRHSHRLLRCRYPWWSTILLPFCQHYL
jgi:hypothetical protein